MPDRVPYKLLANDIQEIWNGKEMTELRRAHLAGEKPPGCSECWQHEAIGKKSKRMIDNERFKHLQDRIGQKDVKPAYLDLKLGNLCNLRCRICYSGNSSSWVTEELFWLSQESPNNFNKKASEPYLNNKFGKWPEKSDDFWSYLTDNMAEIEQLDFTGGEPFLIARHWEFLQECVDSGYSKNISIHYNTNGTTIPSSPEIWSHFKSVEVMVSVDGIGDRFEYQRHPANWDSVRDNINLFRSMPYVNTSICHTVSAINIYYLPEMINWIDEEGFKDYQLWLNTLHGAAYYNVKALPPSVKSEVRKRLERYTKYEIPALLDFMDSEDWNSEYWPIFLLKTSQGDSYRNNDFSKVFPELQDLINESTE